jgi:PEP-CTERM motif-containing protein
MKSKHNWSIRLFCLGLASVWAVPTARATVTGVSASNVDAYFGSQNDAYQDSNPTGLNPWSPIGPGPYFGTSLPPGVPAAPGGNTAPSNVTPFAPTPSTSSFNDGAGNTAISKIVAVAAPGSGTMNDVQINLAMVLNQTGTAAYAYEQLNYTADFTLANTPNSAGFLSGALASTVNRSFFVAGTVGSYVDFGGVMNFWDVPTSGPATLLGSLTFAYNSVTPGPFATTVGSSSFIGTPGSFVNSPDTIRVTGDFYLAGDPSSITVQTVPEPSSLLLAGLGILGLVLARRLR